jgi:hypothetical protein
MDILPKVLRPNISSRFLTDKNGKGIVNDKGISKNITQFIEKMPFLFVPAARGG